MYIVSEKSVKSVASSSLAFEAVKKAFISVSNQESNIFPVVIAEGVSEKQIFSIKSGNIKEPKLCGVKLGSYWPTNNEMLNIPNHSTTTILLDAETGVAKAIINAGYLNGLRTAAANAVASSRLARKDSKILSILGAGHQAHFEVEALCRLFDFEKIYVWNRSSEKADMFSKTITEKYGINSESAEIDTVVSKADILVTATNSTSPLFENANLVKEGAHISAMGADQKGKQELPLSLIEKSFCFADLPKQSVKIGEFESISNSGIKKKVVAMGDVLLNKANGRLSAKDITIFDSSGIAIQDLCAAYFVLEKSIELGLVQKVSF